MRTQRKESSRRMPEFLSHRNLDCWLTLELRDPYGLEGMEALAKIQGHQGKFVASENRNFRSAEPFRTAFVPQFRASTVQDSPPGSCGLRRIAETTNFHAFRK
jgi:hypothetical protein